MSSKKLLSNNKTSKFLKIFIPVKFLIFLSDKFIDVIDKHFFVLTKPSKISSTPISIKYFSNEESLS